MDQPNLGGLWNLFKDDFVQKSLKFAFLTF